jgi:hypothetical protein
MTAVEYVAKNCCQLPEKNKLTNRGGGKRPWRLGMWRKLTTETLIFDWSKFHSRPALLCMPAIAVSLAAGLITAHARQGVAAAAGAFSVGFGSFQQLRRSRNTPMLLAAAVMCISSWIGTLAGLSGIGAVLACTIWGFLYGTVWTLSPGAAWIALQGVVWLVISTAYPAHGLGALTRGSFVLAGGLLQIFFVLGFWQVSGSVTPAFGGASENGEPQTVTDAIQGGWDQRIQGVRASVVLAIAATLYRGFAIPNGYWIPMTAAIVMRGTVQQTFQRGLARIVGTLAGAALATLLAANLRPDPWILAGLVTIFAGLCYLWVYVNYAPFAVCLTSYVVFLLALAGLPESYLIANRSVSTILGGAVALAVHAAFSPIEERDG